MSAILLCKYVVTCFVQNNFYNFISVLEAEPQNLDLSLVVLYTRKMVPIMGRASS